MMFRYFFQGILLMGVMGAIEGKRINSCERQHPCFDVTMEVVDSHVCGPNGGAARNLRQRQLDNTTISSSLELSASRELNVGGASPCDWKICMHWDYKIKGCRKGGNEKIQNVCTRPTNYCSDVYDFSTGLLSENVPTGHTECVIVKAGGAAGFLVRDNTCKDSKSFVYDMGNGVHGTCFPKMNIGEPCNPTNKNPVGKECHWEFRAPPCPATPPPTDAPVAVARSSTLFNLRPLSGPEPVSQSQTSPPVTCLPAEREAVLDFSGSTISTPSTLQQSDGQMRFESVGYTREGETVVPVDMVVKRTPGTVYDYKNLQANGRSGYYGKINVDSNNGEGTFDFCFEESESGAPATLDHFYFSFYDLDVATQTKGYEKITLKKQDFVDYFVTDNTEIVVSQETATDLTLQATEFGVGSDNPDDPNNLSELQKNRGVVFLMKSVSCFQVKLWVTCADGGCGGGRNFLFAGRANQLIPQCPTPDPTGAPTSAPTASPYPSGLPSVSPTLSQEPTTAPSTEPSSHPSSLPSRSPIDLEEICLGAEKETILDFADSSVATPVTLQQSDGELRFESVGTSREGETVVPIDMVVKRTPGTSYDYKNLQANGRSGYYGKINIHSSNGEGTFDFCFEESTTGAPITLDHFYFSFYDLDGTESGGVEQVTLKKSDFVEYFVTDDTEIVVWQETSTDLTLEATKWGVGSDNPDDPNNLSELQKNRGVVFLMKSVSCFQVKLSVRCDVGGCNGGRNFLFAGRANQLIPQCPTPDPTGAPTISPTTSPIAAPTEAPFRSVPILFRLPTEPPVREAATSAPTAGPTKRFLTPPQPVECECVDYFEVPSGGGKYLLAHQEYDEGIDVQIRKRDMGNGSFFNDAAVVMLGMDAAFEVTTTGEYYYINGEPVTLPTIVNGYAIAAPLISSERMSTSIAIGDYSLKFTTFKSPDQLHIKVGAVR